MYPGVLGTNNVPGDDENTYTGKLDIYAGYLNTEINLNNNKWLIVPGIRIESFTQRIDYTVINLPDTDPGYRDSHNTFYLPSLSVRYALDES